MRYPPNLVHRVGQAALAIAVARDECKGDGSYHTVNFIASRTFITPELAQRMLETLVRHKFLEKRVNPGLRVDGYDASELYRIARLFSELDAFHFQRVVQEYFGGTEGVE